VFGENYDSNRSLTLRSGFAAGMFEVASNDDPAQQPLQLDTSARVLRIFFDALFSSGKPVIDSSDQDADDLLGLADKFQSPAVKDKILDALVHSPLVGKDPKRYFFLAARMDRPSLARRAAEQMNDPIEDWTAEDVNEAGGRYFLALLWSAMRQEMLGVHYHGPPRWVTDPWAKVGDSLDRHLR
jgi:hypothetical protein